MTRCQWEKKECSHASKHKKKLRRRSKTHRRRSVKFKTQINKQYHSWGPGALYSYKDTAQHFDLDTFIYLFLE